MVKDLTNRKFSRKRLRNHMNSDKLNSLMTVRIDMTHPTLSPTESPEFTDRFERQRKRFSRLFTFPTHPMDIGCL